jgi:hypothetical protein
MTTTPTKTAATDDAGISRQVAPYAAISAVILAAGAARVAAHATGAEAVTANTVAGAAFVIAVVVAHASKRRILSKALRRRFTAAVYLGASWLAYVAHTGLTWGATFALTMLGTGLSLLWWKTHRIPYENEPAPSLSPIDVPDDDLYTTRWAQNLGAASRAYGGSYLTDLEIIRAGYRYVLRLVPGVHTVAQVRNQPDTLRSGLGLMPGQDVIVEEHPTLPAPAAILTIVTRSPVREPRVWPGPEAGFDTATGSVNLGPFVDGEGPPGKWSVYKRDGIFGGYLQGAPGSGKSRMIEQIACSLAASTSHPTVIWYGDGQNGDSSPMLVKHADYVATTFESIYEMLASAIRVMKINGVENRLAGQVGFHPTKARPGLVVIVDECHKPLSAQENPLLAAATQHLMATIAREGRKVGVALIMASQSPTLDAFGGAGNDADTLRSSLLAGNGVILRSKTPNAKTVFGVDVDPRQFPKLPGYAYLCDPEEGARSAPFRGYWITDELAGYWPPRIGWRSLPRRQGNFAGPTYARRHEIAVQQADTDARLLELADLGIVSDNMVPTIQAAAHVVAGFGDGHPAVVPVRRFWLHAVPDEAKPAELLPGQRKVLDAIVAGHTSPLALRTTTGYSESQVHNLLGELQALGRIVKARHGHYAPTPREASEAKVLPMRPVAAAPSTSSDAADGDPHMPMTEDEYLALLETA